MIYELSHRIRKLNFDRRFLNKLKKQKQKGSFEAWKLGH